MAPSTSVNPLLSDFIKNDKTPWYKKRNLRNLYLLLLPAAIGVEMTSGFDSSMMNGLQAIDPWVAYFHKPSPSITGLLNASYSLGSLIAMPLIPWTNDRFGRRMSVFVGSIIMLVGAALQAGAQNVAMFICARLILGMGIPFAIIGASSLLGELSYPKERPFMTSIFNASWFLGSIAAAATTLGTFAMPNDWSWRIPSAIQGFPSLIQIFTIFLIPESPRWLISKNRSDEAMAILIKYHGEGDPNDAFVKAEYAEIHATLELELEHSKSKWVELFKTKGNRRRTLIAVCIGIFTQMSGNTIISNYLGEVLTQVGFKTRKSQQQINLANTCWGFLNGTLACFAALRFRRRPTYLTSTLGMCLVLTALTICAAEYKIANSAAAGKAMVAMIFLFSPIYNIAFNALTYTYLIEIFPFTIRAKGLAVFQTFGRLSNFFNTFVNPIGLRNIGWKYYLTYVCWLLCEATIVYFLFPETKGPTLEELAFIFEGQEAKELQEERVKEEIGEKVAPTTIQIEDVRAVRQ